MNKLLLAIVIVLSTFTQFSCQKDYSFESGNTSKGSIIKNSTTNSCIASAYGLYNAGTALTSNNYISDSINVTTAGSYTITTNTVNGIYFKGTGNFSSTGQFAVKLMGYGTPTTNGTFNYTLTYDSTSCAVSVVVDTATNSTTGGGSSSGGSSSGTSYLKATIGGTAYDFSDSISDTLMKNTVNNYTTTILYITGTNKSTSASLELTIGKTSSNSITTGTYSNAVSSCQYTDGLLNGYTSGTSYPFSVTVSSVTSTQVTGTFSGTLVPILGGSNITLTNGTFSVPIK